MASTTSDDVSRLLLAYVDESYTADHFYLGALVVDAAATEHVERGLDALLSEHVGQFGITETTELHGHRRSGRPRPVLGAVTHEGPVRKRGPR